ncbi:hypothetical protein Acr_28g0008040 [Actinidia rufa]|uniref:TF-B3 domain-containing protein n=1 Tax=Actinidia rufa TaxID=165716 RepID=A0A7J0HAK3_9ERIC|nr:hypothetical protein Acr_28g0008040 [Actinidia rufa]
MSRNRDNGKGVEAKEEKKLKDLKAQQAAEIERAKDAHRRGISPSSTPLKETVTDAKSGVSSRWPGREVLEADSLPNKPTKDGESKPRRIFLFEMRLTVSDVKQDSLCIPVEFALDHFPPIPQRSPRLYREKVKILSATQDRVWPMTIRYHPEDSVFLLNNKWKEFAQSHEMKAKDMIRFYTPLPRYPDKQYMVVHVKRNPQDDVVISAKDCTKGKSPAVLVKERMTEGGDGKGGDEPQGDGGGGRSDCGSSKEKKSRVGHCCMALK